MLIIVTYVFFVQTSILIQTKKIKGLRVLLSLIFLKHMFYYSNLTHQNDRYGFRQSTNMKKMNILNPPKNIFLPPARGHFLVIIWDTSKRVVYYITLTEIVFLTLYDIKISSYSKL